MSPDDQATFEKTIHQTLTYYRYQPSLAAAILFTILFFLTTSAHLFQLIQKKNWYFIPLLIGGICKYLRFPPYLLLLL